MGCGNTKTEKSVDWYVMFCEEIKPDATAEGIGKAPKPPYPNMNYLWKELMTSLVAGQQNNQIVQRIRDKSVKNNDVRKALMNGVNVVRASSPPELIMLQVSSTWSMQKVCEIMSNKCMSTSTTNDELIALVCLLKVQDNLVRHCGAADAEEAMKHIDTFMMSNRALDKGLEAMDKCGKISTRHKITPEVVSKFGNLNATRDLPFVKEANKQTGGVEFCLLAEFLTRKWSNDQMRALRLLRQLSVDDLPVKSAGAAGGETRVEKKLVVTGKGEGQALITEEGADDEPDGEASPPAAASEAGEKSDASSE